jgi:hypothetical protein
VSTAMADAMSQFKEGFYVKLGPRAPFDTQQFPTRAWGYGGMGGVRRPGAG